ncbi:MAG: DUF3999 family protein [Verrucomicrobiae bacterium]
MIKATLNLLALLLLTTQGFALTPSEWPRLQKLDVPGPGLTKIPLPAVTFDSAQPTLSDLRLLDPAGKEVPYVLDRNLPPREVQTSLALAPKSFRTIAEGDATQLLIETGTEAPLEAIDLETPAPFFLKAAHVEISSDGAQWESMGPAVPVFRQLGAEQLHLSLDRHAAAFVRVTLDEFRSRKVAFSGAKLILSPALATPPVLAPLGVRITQRDDYAGETVLTLTLDGSHVPLAGLTLEAKDQLFMRRVEVSIREMRGNVSSERTIGSGTIYRVALDGAAARTQLDIPLSVSPPTRELLIHIRNGDSPPLTFEGAQAQQHPVNLLFNATAAGGYTLLSGNPQASAPRYDLAAFAGEMHKASATQAVPGNVQEVPDYHPRESLTEPPMPDVPLAGAPLESKAWARLQPIQITRAGVQELELDVEALARSRPDGRDLRVLREGKQIPYVIERPALARSIPLTPIPATDARRPSLSIWKLQLPQSGIPIDRVTLTTASPLFQRQLRLYEKVAGPEGQTIEIPLASGEWTRTPDPGTPETKTFFVHCRPGSDTIWIETENGDNPPIALGTCQAVYPVVRLIFKVAETDGFVLTYTNKNAQAPRYDLDLVALKLLTSSRNIARLTPGRQNPSATHSDFEGINGGYVFWAALSLVVVVMLVVVAKLLPTPPAA